MSRLNLVELTELELTNVTGGSRLRVIRELLEIAFVAIGIHDAFEDFKEGWNDCAPESKKALNNLSLFFELIFVGEK